MDKTIYKSCARCNGYGRVVVHTPSEDSRMFALLDFGIWAAASAIKGHYEVCRKCGGEGLVLDHVELISN